MDKGIKVDSPAKVNLFLEVKGKREDGYHEVELVMQSIDLKDTLTITLEEDQSEKVKIECNKEGIPTGEDNLVHKAVKAIMANHNIPPIKVYLNKKIPAAAGLAGGSSNAAAALWGLNELLELKIPQDRLSKIAQGIGADVPFCINGGTSLATGLGEKLTVLPSIPLCYFLLVKPYFGIKTGEVYRSMNKGMYSQKGWENKLCSKQLIKALEEKSLNKIADNLYNSMQPIVNSWFPILKTIAQTISDGGARGVLMSGSGPTIYGIFKHMEEAKSTKEWVEKSYGEVDCFVTVPRHKGVEVGKE